MMECPEPTPSISLTLNPQAGSAITRFMSAPEQREQTASQLQSAITRASQMTAFVGLDGFVDEILHVVDKRETVSYTHLTLPTNREV